MSSRRESLASACLVALIISIGGSQLSAQAPWRSMAAAPGKPIEFRSDLAWHFVARQSDGTVLLNDAVSSRQASFSLPDPLGSVRHKSPLLAWFLSFLVPGGGQGYNGQWGKAAAFFGGAVTGVVVANQETCNSLSFCTGPGIWLLVASSVGSQIDAPISAATINKKAQGEVLRPPQTILVVATIHF